MEILIPSLWKVEHPPGIASECISEGYSRWLPAFGSEPASRAMDRRRSFLTLWLIATLVNRWVGVSKAGYSVKDEAPVAPLAEQPGCLFRRSTLTKQGKFANRVLDT